MKKIKILIVEDDVSLAERLLRSFASNQLSAFVAHDLESAMKIQQRDKCTHCLLDIRLSKENGMTLISWLKDNGCPEIVILSGFGSINAAVEALKLGAKNFLSKPTSFDEILSALGLSGMSDSVSAKEISPSLAEVEWLHIQRVLHAHDGNITKAAAELGLHRQALQRKLRNLPRKNS